VNGLIQGVSFNNPSDYRIKEEVKPLDLKKFSIDHLNPVSYKYKDSQKESIGVIAHELQDYFPFLVEGEKDGEKIQSVNYIGLIGVLVKEIQELKKIGNNNTCQINTLKQQVEELKEEINDIKHTSKI
jgi:FtsZ-binding cell division protein ZapB